MGNPVRLSDASRVMGHGEPGAIITNLSDASRVMGNPVQFTCRRTARARTARARTAGTRNASMGSASAHNASMHSASTKHGPAHPRDVDDVDERSAHDLDECCASTPRAPHEVVQHGHAQQWHAQQAHETRAQARTANRVRQARRRAGELRCCSR